MVGVGSYAVPEALVSVPPPAARQPFKRGKSLEEPGLPPPEGAPRLVPETQREPREKNGEARWLWPQPAPSHKAPRKSSRARLVPENVPRGKRKRVVTTPSQKSASLKPSAQT